MVRGVILAAGGSTRMGRPKAALTLGDNGETFLMRLIRRFRQASLPDIVVVTGASADVVRHAAGPIRPPVRVAHNEYWANGQLTSMLLGLGDRAGDVVEAAMVTLVDTPMVQTATMTTLLRVWRQGRAPIVRPARHQTHGHPVIFDRAVFDALRRADPAVGAKEVVRSYADRIANVEVDDPGAYIDVDTPDEYQRMLRELPH